MMVAILLHPKNRKQSSIETRKYFRVALLISFIVCAISCLVFVIICLCKGLDWGLFQFD